MEEKGLDKYFSCLPQNTVGQSPRQSDLSRSCSHCGVGPVKHQQSPQSIQFYWFMLLLKYYFFISLHLNNVQRNTDGILMVVVPRARNKYCCWSYQHPSEKKKGQSIPEKYFPIVQGLNKTPNNNNNKQHPNKCRKIIDRL